MKKSLSLLCITALLIQSNPAPLLGQSEEEDVFITLSPFEVDRSSGSGYRASSTLAGSRLNTKLSDVAASVTALTADLMQDLGATIVNVDAASSADYENANGVVVRFAIAHYDDSETERRKRLHALLARIEAEAMKQDGVYFAPGAMRIAKGDRKRLRGKSKAQLTSYAHFSLSFRIGPDHSPLKQVAALRKHISELELDDDTTRVYYGEALLLTRTPFANSAYGLPISPLQRSPQATSELGGSISYLVDANGNVLRETTPSCSVTLIKPADRVQIQFAIDTAAPTEAERIQAIDTSIEAIKVAVSKLSGIKFTPGSLLLRHGEASTALAKPSNAYTSQAQFTLSFELEKDTDAAARVAQLKSLVRSTPLPEAIQTIHFGAASLVVDNPQSQQGEIHAAIFAEIATLQNQVGDRYEVIPELRHKRVALRRHSLSDVEYWIHFDYRIESLAERERVKLREQRKHEVALAAAQAKPPCCGK